MGLDGSRELRKRMLVAVEAATVALAEGGLVVQGADEVDEQVGKKRVDSHML